MRKSKLSTALPSSKPEIKNGSLQAFTLLEIVIALLLMSILSVFIFQAFSTFNRLLHEQQGLKAMQYEFDLLCHRLRIDCERAQVLCMQEDENLVIRDSIGDIAYSFAGDYVLRSQYGGRIDTFNINNDKLDYAVVKASTDIPWITELRIQLYMNSKPVSLNIRKEYAAQDLVRDATSQQ